MSRAAGLPGSVRSKRSGANDFQPPQPCSSRLGTFRLHLLSEHGCQPLAPSESKYLRLVADNASYASWPKNAGWVVNKNVLGAGDFKPSGRSRYARTESLIELANLLPHAARHHHAKPVQHLRPRQFPAASSVVAAGSDSHLLDMLGIGGKAFCPRTIGDGAYRTEASDDGRENESGRSPTSNERIRWTPSI